FFFSSRRRHTRSKRDWSSDVCSSDLDSIEAALTIRDGYNFKGFWQYYFDDDKWTNPDENDPLNVEQGTYDEENKTWSCIWNSGYGYWSGETRLVARLTADVNFHKYGEETPVTVERKYDSLLFCTDANARSEERRVG